jgi:hypothetical protein
VFFDGRYQYWPETGCGASSFRKESCVLSASHVRHPALHRKVTGIPERSVRRSPEGTRRCRVLSPFGATRRAGRPPWRVRRRMRFAGKDSHHRMEPMGRTRVDVREPRKAPPRQQYRKNEGRREAVFSCPESGDVAQPGVARQRSNAAMPSSTVTRSITPSCSILVPHFRSAAGLPRYLRAASS